MTEEEMRTYQDKVDKIIRMKEHSGLQIRCLREGSMGISELGVCGSGNWHTNKCANLDELDEVFDEGRYFES